MQLVSVLIVAVLAVSQNPKPLKPQAIKGAIRKADKLIKKAYIDSEYWVQRATRAPSAELQAQYDAAAETIRQSGVFDRPVKVSVPIGSIRSEHDGGMVVEGDFVARKIRRLSTDDELRVLYEFDAETKRIKKARQIKENNLVELKDKKVSSRERYQSEREARQRARNSHRNQLEGRASDRARILADINRTAKPRMDALQNVIVLVEIPANLASRIDKAKVASAKRVLFTGQLLSFEIRSPMEEIDAPAAIGRIVVKASKLPDKFMLSP